jgi:hypothetical protein
LSIVKIRFWLPAGLLAGFRGGLEKMLPLPVPKVRIHLPPAESLVKLDFLHFMPRKSGASLPGWGLSLIGQAASW